MTEPGNEIAAGPGRSDSLHVSHAVARDQVIRILSAALAQGRLTVDEHDARASQVPASRCHADLAALIADLPAADGQRRAGGRLRGHCRGQRARGGPAVAPRQRASVPGVFCRCRHPAGGSGHDRGPDGRRTASEAVRRAATAGANPRRGRVIVHAGHRPATARRSPRPAWSRRTGPARSHGRPVSLEWRSGEHRITLCLRRAGGRCR